MHALASVVALTVPQQLCVAACFKLTILCQGPACPLHHLCSRCGAALQLLHVMQAGRRSQALQPQSALVPSAVALEARLQAVSAEKGQLQQQLTSTLRLLQKARTDLWTSQDAFSELERQVRISSPSSLRLQSIFSGFAPATNESTIKQRLT